MTDSEGPAAPDTETAAPRPEKKGARVVVLLVLGLALMAGAGYAAAYAAAGDRVPRGTTVAGVDIGGKTATEAQAALVAELRPRAAEPIPVTVDGTADVIDPGSAGLGVDYVATVKAAGATRSWSPAWLWSYFTGGEEIEPVVEVDDALLTRALDRLGAAHGTVPRDGQVSFDKSRVAVRDPRDGRALDGQQARDAVLAAYLTDGTAELTLVPQGPDIDATDVRSAVDEFANPAVSGPVTLVFGKSPVALTPAEFTAALELVPRDGTLEPVVRRKVLTALVDAGVGEAGQPVDATVALVNGAPQVVPAKPGVRYRPAQVAEAFLQLVQTQGERRATVPATVAEPAFTTQQARALKITEKVSTFTTYYPHADYRNTNIGRAAQLVNGTLLKPGDVFSLNGTVGERTRENGFTEGFIISNGIFKEDLGGGVSQMATTTFNAMFFAGLKDIEHKPHSFYIDRYPVGREATVAWPSVDLRFENDTPYGVLVEARVTPSTPSTSGVVTVSMWSTKYWDITTRTGDRYNPTSPATRTLRTEDCYPNTGYGGFDIDVWRYFRRAGSSELVRTEKFHTHYIPSDTVICKPPRP